MLHSTLNNFPGVAGMQRLISLLGSTVLLAVALPAQAYRVTPIVMDFDPAGRGATRNYEIFNDGTAAVPIELKIVRREMDANGTETYGVADQFDIFPPQLTVAVGQTQTVQVRWKGDAAPQQELAFRFIAEQLPVELDKDKAPGASINIMVRYEGSIYVVPKNATPDVKLESVAKVKSPDGKESLEVVLANAGKSHGVVRDATLSLRDSTGKRIDVPAAELAKVNNTNILAGSKRRYLLAMPAGAAEGALEGIFRSATGR